MKPEEISLSQEPSNDEYLLGDRIDNLYPEKERGYARILDELARKIYCTLKPEQQALFNMDGFYPHYYAQHLKILFVGREACWMSKKNYMATLLAELKEGRVGYYSVNQYPFHKRQFYIAYGLLARAAGFGAFPKWNDVPWASDLARLLFARESINKDLIEDVEIKPVSCLQGISWAFMNLSKISNDTGDWTTDNKRYGSFVRPRHDLVREEIEILQPDVIIGANVYDLVPILGYEDAESDRDTDDNCYYYPPKNGFPPFFNCYHFSAIKNDQTCFYDAVMTVADKYWAEIIHK